MDAQPGSAAHLQLDRRWANLHFASWRLNNAILHSEGCVTLPAPAAPPQVRGRRRQRLRQQGCGRPPVPRAKLLHAHTPFSLHLQASDTDYVTARHAALLNGITQQPRGCYVFLEGKGEGPRGGHLQLHQIELGEPSKPPQLHRLCGEFMFRLLFPPLPLQSWGAWCVRLVSQ